MSSETPTVTCPTDDTLGALVEHALEESEAARVSSHIDSCDACRAIVIAAVRANAATPAAKLAGGTPTLFGVRPPVSLVGTRMGRYAIKALLGSGGMGQVYEAFDAELDRAIALKVLRPELAHMASVADRLARESKLMAKVAHPSVITVYDVGREGDTLFIAMELIRGETLALHLRRAKADWRATLAIFDRAGQGLAAAHDAGIVHRDFKPDNVLIDGTKVVVTDFGIATAATTAEAPVDGKIGADARLTATNTAIGTPAYMAPEQLSGGAVDQRADVFAFSVTLWEALFNERPFRGKTVDELRAAMKQKPRVPRTAVPAQLVRALEKGLAIDPAERWPDMRALLRALAVKRSRVALAAGGVALVGAGIAGALLLRSESDPCRIAWQVDTSLDKKLAQNVAAWRDTHAKTCNADRDPPQAPTVHACLDARRLEIEAFAEVAQRDGAKAAPLTRMMVDPARCIDPRAGLLFSRVPADAAQRAVVADIRYRALAIEATRDRSEFATALPAAKALLDEAKAKSVWPPAQAELLYLLGTTQSMGGDNVQAIATLREAAALGERTHHGYIAANSWIQLIQSAAFDAGDPGRALEYATYADAALDGIGRPPDLEVLFLYFKGTAMVEADQSKDAEAILRRAIALAETSAPQYLARATLGLGYMFEDQGRYADAADAYRRAIAQLAQSSITTSAHTFRERLAINLAMLGQAEEAEKFAREAVAMADKSLGEDNVDRAVVRTTLAQVLQQIGKLDDALVEVRRGEKLLANIVGERNERYGEVLALDGNILVDLEKFDEASKVLARACEIIAFGVGEQASPHADCLLTQGIALDGLGKSPEALAATDRALKILIAADGELHPRVASALVQRGALRDLVGQHAEGVADLEKAIATFQQLQLEPGHLAGAKWALGKTLWKTDRVRAKKLVEEAIELFGKASDSWASSKAEAEAFLRMGGRTQAPSR